MTSTAVGLELIGPSSATPEASANEAATGSVASGGTVPSMDHPP